jgi:hypothetical protein
MKESWEEAPYFGEHIKTKLWESAMGWKYGFDAASIKAGEALQVLKREHEETVIGLSYGAYLAREKATEAVAGAQKGISGVGAKIGESFGNLGESFGNVGSGVGEFFGNVGESTRSLKWLMYILVPIIIFIAIMVAIGYSGVGGPTARIAEREYAKRQ